jgi:hypothetical protein
MTIASCIKGRSNVSNLLAKVITEAAHQLLQRSMAGKFRVRFLQKEGIHHLEERLLLRCFSYLSVEILHLLPVE